MKKQYIKAEVKKLYIFTECSISHSSVFIDDDSVTPDVEDFVDYGFPINDQGDI